MVFVFSFKNQRTPHDWTLPLQCMAKIEQQWNVSVTLLLLLPRKVTLCWRCLAVIDWLRMTDWRNNMSVVFLVTLNLSPGLCLNSGFDSLKRCPSFTGESFEGCIHIHLASNQMGHCSHISELCHRHTAGQPHVFGDILEYLLSC